MTPQQFYTRLKGSPPAAAYLFAGPEMHRRRACRRILIERFLEPDQREDGITRHDLDGDLTLAQIMDDASSPSLFASRRILLVASAEAAMPRSAASDKEEQPGQKALAAWIRNPAPDTVIVFDCGRYTYDSDDKSRMERLRKFYAAIPDVVEFPPYSDDEARKLAAEEAKRSGLRIAPQQLEELAEAAGYEGSRIVNEIEKLSLLTQGREVTREDIVVLTPDARSTTVFALVAALGRGDRATSLDLLDTLVKGGEYLGLALSFLGTQFRMALAAREEGLKSPQQIQGFFTKIGIGMWPSRANQVSQTATAFSTERLEDSVRAIYEADKALRDRSPDDRLVMERLVLALTGNPKADSHRISNR